MTTEPDGIRTDDLLDLVPTTFPEAAAHRGLFAPEKPHLMAGTFFYARMPYSGSRGRAPRGPSDPPSC